MLVSSLFILVQFAITRPVRALVAPPAVQWISVAMAVFSVGQFSGAQLNPAVTLGSAIQGGTDWSDVPKYIGGEFSGAFIGAIRL